MARRLANDDDAAMVWKCGTLRWRARVAATPLANMALATVAALVAEGWGPPRKNLPCDITVFAQYSTGTSQRFSIVDWIALELGRSSVLSAS